MNSLVSWKHPEYKSIPSSLEECGTEPIGHRRNEKKAVTRYCTTFKSYSGEEEIPTYGGKAIVVDQGHPTYAEFAALSLFRQCAWEGIWYDSYRRKKRSNLYEESDGTDSVNDLLDSIAETRATYGIEAHNIYPSMPNSPGTTVRANSHPNSVHHNQTGAAASSSNNNWMMTSERVKQYVNKSIIADSGSDRASPIASSAEVMHPKALSDGEACKARRARAKPFWLKGSSAP